MQRLSDLEAQNEQLTAEGTRLKAQAAELQAENRALREAVQRMPSAEALAEAIGARLTRVEQNLREDFTGKFAASFLLATETITGRIVAVDERQEKIEARQKAFEGRITTHMEQVGSTLNQADEKQVGLLRRFSAALKQHHAKNEGLLAAQEDILAGCQQAAQATAQAAARCVTFEQHYKAAIAQANQSIQSLRTKTESELTGYLQDLKAEASDVLRPVMRRVKQLTESQYKWRAVWLSVGLSVGIMIAVGVAWIASPTPSTLIDAARWRNWQAGFSKVQADKLNDLLSEIEKEKAKKAGEEQRNDPNSPLGQ